MSNVDPLIRDIVAESEYADKITIPVDVDWTIEICNLIEVLNVEAFQKDGQFSLEGISLVTLQQLTPANVLLITGSRLIMSIVDPLIRDIIAESEYADKITIPVDVDWTIEI